MLDFNLMMLSVLASFLVMFTLCSSLYGNCNSSLTEMYTVNYNIFAFAVFIDFHCLFVFISVCMFLYVSVYGPYCLILNKCM